MNLQVIKKRIRKTLAYAFTGLVFLLITLFLILQMPPVQNAIVGRLLRNFSNVSGFTTKIDRFSLLWFDRLELGGVTILDPEGNEMIAAKSILLNFDISELLNENDVNIDGIILDSARVLITKIKESDTTTDLNINIFISNLNKISKKTEESTSNPRVNIGEAVLNQSLFTYIDQYRDSVRQGFDYNHFTLDIDEVQLQNFLASNDTTQFDVATLIVHDQKTNFKIKQLSTFFRVTSNSLSFTDLNLNTTKSIITDSVVFQYKDRSALRDFVNLVDIHASFKNTIIHPDELELFAPGSKIVNKSIALTGNFNGRVKRFKLSEMETTIGNTHLRGSLDMDGLPNLNETFIILDLHNSQLQFEDFDFLIKPGILTRLKPLGTLQLSGQFLGYPSDFVANGDIYTNLGRVKSDINFKIDETDFDKSAYTGKLRMMNFDVGRFLEDTVSFQKVSLDGNVSGVGLTKETANFKLRGKLSSLGILSYNYSNITTDARFSSGFFMGNLKIDDPNLKFSAQGSVDLNDNHNIIQVKATLDTANLQTLNLSKKHIALKTNLDIDVTGLDLDSITGTAKFHGLDITYQDETLKLDSIQLTSQHNNKSRLIDLNGSLFDVAIDGDYQLSTLSNDIQRLFTEISLNLRNDDYEIREYYSQKRGSPKEYAAHFNLQIKDITPISDLLDINLVVNKNTTLQGSFRSGYTTVLTAFSQIDTLTYNGSTFLNTELDLNASKISDSTDILAVGLINSMEQMFGPVVKTQNLIVEGVWNKNHIDFELDAEQLHQSNYVQLKGAIDFMVDSARFKLLPSMIHLLDRNWHIDPGNEVVGKGHEWTVRNLEFKNRNQSIRIDGHLSDDPLKEMIFQVNNIDLSILDVITNRKFSGTVNANVEVSNYFLDPFVQNDLLVDSLRVNNFYIGDITGNNKWDNELKQFSVNFFIDRRQSRIVELEGTYSPNHENPLAITASLKKASVRILGPFLEELFSDLNGEITGDFKITGPLSDPAIHGEGRVVGGQLSVNYTKVFYNFNGIVGLRPEEIYFNNVQLTDSYQNTGVLNGKIMHHNFFGMVVDLGVRFNNLQILNTSGKDNTSFYGQGFASGEVTFTGHVDNLVIASTAKSEKNSRIFIPIGSSESAEKKEFINFISLMDTTTNEIKVQGIKKEVSGITFDLNLEVTPDLYCEIIFDIKSGDIIRGRGNGDLKLILDTKGEFNMFGSVAFTEGWYNFTLYDIINKEFEIQSGSHITWFGDPYKATLDINATYTQLASFAPIVAASYPSSTTAASSSDLRRKYPVQVLLNLTGPMLSPQINFDILAKNLPQVNIGGTIERLDFLFAAFKNKLDEQELKRQVFSLIVLRRFSPPDAFNTSGTLYNSVSELLSNQLSYWMSQVDENLEIDVDLGTLDAEALNVFQLRFSYTFLNGRLRITRDGTFGNSYRSPQADNGTNLASVAGDWTIDYFLTADGKFKVKMYNRTNYNQLATTIGNQNYFTTGVSLQHVQSFNEFKDLIKFRQKENEEKIKKDKGNQEKENDDQSTSPKTEAIKEDEDDS